MRTLVLRTAFAATLSLAALGWAQTSLQQQMQRMLAGSAPFALQLSGPHTTMPVISERNLFLYTALSALDAMSIDCAAISQSFPTWDEVFCAGFVGKAPQLADEWRDPQPTSAFSLVPWDTSDPAMVSAAYIVENGMLMVMAISLPDEDASAVLGMWMECEGRIGSSPDVSRWSDSEKASLAACLERVQLGATALSAPPPPAGPTTDASVVGSAGTAPYRIMTTVSVNIDVLRVRDAPGLSGNVVGRAERGLSGDLLDPRHRDVDGFRWWHVRFANSLRGWVADGDNDLDYLVRSRDGTRLTPFAPLPPLATLAERVFGVANVAAAPCPAWAQPYPAVACGAGTESYPGDWPSVATPMMNAIDAYLFANDFTVYFEWGFDGGADGPEMSAFFSDGVQVVAVTIQEKNPVMLLLHQYYP